MAVCTHAKTLAADFSWIFQFNSGDHYLKQTSHKFQHRQNKALCLSIGDYIQISLLRLTADELSLNCIKLAVFNTLWHYLTLVSLGGAVRASGADSTTVPMQQRLVFLSLSIRLRRLIELLIIFTAVICLLIYRKSERWITHYHKKTSVVTSR